MGKFLRPRNNEVLLEKIDLKKMHRSTASIWLNADLGLIVNNFIFETFIDIF